MNAQIDSVVIPHAVFQVLLKLLFHGIASGYQ